MKSLRFFSCCNWVLQTSRKKKIFKVIFYWRNLGKRNILSDKTKTCFFLWLDNRRPWWTYSISFHCCQYVVSIRQSLFRLSNILIVCKQCTLKLRKESVLFSYRLSSLFLITFYKCNSHLLLFPPPFFSSSSSSSLYFLLTYTCKIKEREVEKKNNNNSKDYWPCF